MQASKNGFFYVIDRRDGKLVSAKPYSKVTWAEKIDLATGRPVELPGARFDQGTPQVIFPGALGAHAAVAMSYSRDTGLAYIPTTEYGGVYADPEGDLDEWQPKPNMSVNTGIGRPKGAPTPPPSKSFLVAWDPAKQQQAWSVPLTGPVNGGTLATGGNLVVQGQVTGELSIYAADSGRKLWSFDAQTGIVAQPITYSVKGEQYMTVIAGWRGMGSPSGAKPDWDYRLQPRRVLTFKLGGTAKLPPPGPRTSPFVDDPAFVVDPAKASIGAGVAARCVLCHGGGLVSGGTAPDLRKSQIPLALNALTAVVHDGALVPRGMPQFGEFTPAEIEGLQHYIRQRAREGLAAAK
jgi:quinohemoprotein ethanol dehydrogenase